MDPLIQRLVLDRSAVKAIKAWTRRNQIVNSAYFLEQLLITERVKSINVICIVHGCSNETRRRTGICNAVHLEEAELEEGLTSVVHARLSDSVKQS